MSRRTEASRKHAILTLWNRRSVGADLWPVSLAEAWGDLMQPVRLGATEPWNCGIGEPTPEGCAG